MKLLLDENLSPQHAALLRANGHDAIAVVDAGLAGESDDAIRTFAVETAGYSLRLTQTSRTFFGFHQRARRE